LVLVDENGGQIKKWTGSRDLDAIISEIGNSAASVSSQEIQSVASSSAVSVANSNSTQTATPVSTNNYIEYSPALLKQTGITNRVLFFKADWCPSCNSLDKEIKSDLSKIPANTLILDVDYDKNQDLRTKYGVTSQHTLVLVDENGGQIKKWTGSRDLDAILKQI
jgi:thiol:disulfide interchange protein